MSLLSEDRMLTPAKPRTPCNAMQWSYALRVRCFQGACLGICPFPSPKLRARHKNQAALGSDPAQPGWYCYPGTIELRHLRDTLCPFDSLSPFGGTFHGGFVMGSVHPQLDFLAAFSRTSLESFELSRLNLVANLRKELHQLVDEWIEAEIESRIARWLIEDRGTNPRDPAPITPESSAALRIPAPAPGPFASAAGIESSALESRNLVRNRKPDLCRKGTRRFPAVPTASRHGAETPIQSSLFPVDETPESLKPPGAIPVRPCEALNSLVKSIRSRTCSPHRSGRASERISSSRLVRSSDARRVSRACTTSDALVAHCTPVLIGSVPPSVSTHLT